MTETNNNGGQELRTRKIFENETSRYIAIIMIVIPVVAFLYSMKSDIALIQQSIENINQNHEVHIQDILQQLNDQKAEIADLQKQEVDDQKQILLLLNKLDLK